ncbi:MAG: hypothetical protein Fur0032_09540 [Terrimicrobiaceae bacterium]
MPLIFLLILWVSLTSPLLAEGTYSELNDLSVANALGGAEILQIIRSPAKILAQRVDTPGAEKNSEPSDEFPGIIELGAPVDVPSETAAKLRNILGNSATYLAVPKRCRFRANVRLIFEAASKPPVELIFCFGCGEVEIWQDGQLTAFSPFDPAYGEILAAAQEIFPNDEFLKSFSPEVFAERAKAMRQ